jgi:type VI secretion system protein ImpH
MKDAPLNEQLFENPTGFDFFQAVRILERLYPERDAVGRDGLPIAEVVRFRTHPTLSFPASQLQQIKEVDEDFTDYRKIELFVNFMGMTGALGVLPIHYTELIMDRARQKDTSLHAFLDIFSHRLISHFFRAWEKYRFPIAYERSQHQKGEIDSFTEFLFDIAGLGTRGLRGNLAISDESLLPYTGLIAQKPHSAVALQQILSDYFHINVEVKQFFGQWLWLEENDLTLIGTQNNRLGLNTIIGKRIWDDQTKFRLVIGAVGFKEFLAFLPNGSAYPALLSLVKFFVGEEFDFDVQLRLKAKEVPACILTTRAKRRPMLGWTSFLKTNPFKEDDEQVVLQV